MREKIQVLDKKTKDGYPLKSLHENFFDTVVDRKDHTAIVWYEDRRKEMTYAQLKDKVLKLVEMLKKNNVSKNEYIAVLMPKGVWQIISVLAILASGCVYVPIDIDWPEERRNKICKKANIKYVICMSTVPVHAIEDVKIIYGDQSEDYQRATDIILNNIKSSAYVIFTSGTTGEPKGVEITHESAVNTIIDINERFEISSQDKCFAISSLSFDLSVYDIFGTLMAGGTIVLPRPEEQKMADRWLDIVLAEKITIWNSVPAIYEMLLMVAEAEEQILPFKKVLLSGDWVLPELFRRTKAITKHCQFIALGGATEAAIWSVYYIVNDIKEEWGAIPMDTHWLTRKLW